MIAGVDSDSGDFMAHTAPDVSGVLHEPSQPYRTTRSAVNGTDTGSYPRSTGLSSNREPSSTSHPPPTNVTWSQQLLLVAPILLFSMVAHEYAHGWAALRQGDRTAQMLGRLTWNPLRHIDPFMTILLPLMLAWAGAPILGGAKPVPVDPRNFRNLRRGDIIVSLAGVTANALIVVACIPVVILVGLVGDAVPALATGAALLQRMAIVGIFLNMILIIFNLLPIPPLDGSHVFKYLLPARFAYLYERLGSAGILLLIGLMYVAPGMRTVVFAPALVVQSAAQHLYAPFLLPSPLL